MLSSRSSLLAGLLKGHFHTVPFLPAAPLHPGQNAVTMTKWQPNPSSSVFSIEIDFTSEELRTATLTSELGSACANSARQLLKRLQKQTSKVPNNKSTLVSAHRQNSRWTLKVCLASYFSNACGNVNPACSAIAAYALCKTASGIQTNLHYKPSLSESGIFRCFKRTWDKLNCFSRNLREAAKTNPSSNCFSKLQLVQHFLALSVSAPKKDDHTRQVVFGSTFYCLREQRHGSSVQRHASSPLVLFAKLGAPRGTPQLQPASTASTARQAPITT